MVFVGADKQFYLCAWMDLSCESMRKQRAGPERDVSALEPLRVYLNSLRAECERQTRSETRVWIMFAVCC